MNICAQSGLTSNRAAQRGADALTILYGFLLRALYDFYHYFYLVTNTLFYVSSAVTPVLYNAVSSSFRKLYLEALGKLCGRHSPRQPLPLRVPDSVKLWAAPRNTELEEIEE